MIGAIKRLMLQLLRVPPEPQLPAGATESARMFRASKRYLQLKLLNWGVGQVFTPDEGQCLPALLAVD